MTSAKPSNYINKNIKLRQGTAIYAREQQITTGNSKLRQGTANYASDDTAKVVSSKEMRTEYGIKKKNHARKKWLFYGC